MLALLLNHPPLFVAGEVALGLSLTLFVGALIAAAIRGAPRISQLREAGDPNPTIVRPSLGETVHGQPNVPRPALATRPGRDPRCANEAPTFEATRSRYAVLNLAARWDHGNSRQGLRQRGGVPATQSERRANQWTGRRIAPAAVCFDAESTNAASLAP
jgi:hypothetical protein